MNEKCSQKGQFFVWFWFKKSCGKKWLTFSFVVVALVRRRSHGIETIFPKDMKEDEREKNPKFIPWSIILDPVIKSIGENSISD